MKGPESSRDGSGPFLVPIIMVLPTLLRRLLASTAFAAAITVVGCDRSPDTTTDRGTPDTSSALQTAGVDSRMVERREDGVLVASRDSLLKTPGYVVDSIFPPAEAMRRFRAELSGTPPTVLSGSIHSSDDLIRRYWRLLSNGDTTGLETLVLTKAEFAFLYLPESPEFKAGMPPAIAWLLLERTASTALSKARQVAAASGALPVTGTTCSRAADAPKIDLNVFGPCGVIVRKGVARDTIWIANRAVAYRGVMKLLSYANSL